MLALQVRADTAATGSDATQASLRSAVAACNQSHHTNPDKTTSLPATAKKFSQLKQHIDVKHARRLRGPRAHILHAQKYLVADGDSIERGNSKG
ncbi:hypothetical protein P43SY_011488 [Pythium insidiosum]|uniref:Uncharacterized protein n=1 Tax=Pythium insidiosum TaxID=114742 RepID=A0AAD5Q2F3_PYTIN|nr:hypothetical protein P43SY_011488 [Pythium insidiosum]